MSRHVMMGHSQLFNVCGCMRAKLLTTAVAFVFLANRSQVPDQEAVLSTHQKNTLCWGEGTYQW